MMALIRGGDHRVGVEGGRPASRDRRPAAAGTRPGWGPCSRRACGAGLPPGNPRGPGWLPRRGRLLRAQRVPDHRPAGGQAGQARAAESGPVLGPPGTAAAARAGCGPGHGDGGGGTGRAGPAGRAPAGSGRGGRLREQLVPGDPPRLLFRVVRAATAAAAPVVAGHRGAVLPHLAADPGTVAGRSEQPSRPGRGRLGRSRRVGSADGVAVHPRQ